MSYRNIYLDFDWKELIDFPKDAFKSEKRNTLLRMLQQICLIRAFEDLLLKLQSENLIHGPVHSSIGQEAVAVGAVSALRKTDLIGGTHRAHHQFLAKEMAYHAPDDYDPLNDDFPSEAQLAVNRLLAEIMGLEPGYCGGRGGSMHLYDSEAGIMGTNAIVAGGIPILTGVAFAQEYLKTDRIVLSFIGDGAVNQGSFHESLNLAGLWKLPIIYVIENNLYAVATHFKQSASAERLSMRAFSYGMKARVVDGMDPMAIRLVLEEAAREVRGGGSPILVEAVTYRFLHHGGGASGSSYGYRPSNEEEKWRRRDPFSSFPRQLIESGILTKDDAVRLNKGVEMVIERAKGYCLEREASSGRYVVRNSLWPSASSLTKGVLSDGPLKTLEFVEENDLTLSRKTSYIEAIADVTERWMEKDEHVFVIGEEVGHFRGGVYNATAGIPDKFPDRLFNTPISEAGFSGLACGAAMTGLKPVVEIMFSDFVLVAADQIFNQIGKLRYIYGGKVDIPIIMRTQISIGRGYGGQHSMNPVGLFVLFPGWRIVAPSTPFDYIGLFNTAMHTPDPVFFVEHFKLYNQTGLVPKDDLDYYVEFGKARKVNEGEDITVLAYSSTVQLCKEVASHLSQKGISSEIIDLRTLDLANIDYDTIGASLSKTGKIAIIEEAPRSCGLGNPIARAIQERFFDDLDFPILHVAGADVPLPVSKPLESASMPSFESVHNTIKSFFFS